MTQLLSINVRGRFRVLGPDGSDRTPTSKKGKALLAMLALSPGHEKSRPWLQTKLWSQQQPTQQAASLRQCLSTVRKELGPFRDCLVSCRQVISLTALVEIGKTGELLEGLVIKDPEFEEWLADQTLVTTQVEKHSGAEVAMASTKPKIYSILDDTDGDARFFSALVADSVAQRLGEAGSIEVLEAPEAETSSGRLEFLLRTSAMKKGRHSGIRIRLEAANSRAIVWSGYKVLQSDGLNEVDSVEVRRLMNHAVDAATDQFRGLRPSKSAESYSTALCFRAVAKMFTLHKPDLLESEHMLEKASSIDDRGIYHAWRAYLKIIQFGERMVTDRAVTAEQASGLIAHALERGVDNSMVFALASYVQSLVFRNYAAAYELAEQSLKMSSINPLAWAFWGIAKLHLGELENAHKCTQYAREISGPGPHRYQLNMLACQTAVATGRFDDAIRLAETTGAMALNYAPPRRYLAALLKYAGREREAAKVLTELRKLEPDFSFDLLRDTSYPAAALRLSPLGDKLGEISRRMI